MKKIYLFAAAALAMASCANDEFVGETPLATQQSTDGAILFSPGTSKMTRADHVGADAANLLNKNFVVAGYKGGTAGTPNSVVTTKVFDHYNVSWTQNTAGTTASNTADWEYAGKTVSTWNTSGSTQEIKYWDYSVDQYDFIAFSTSDGTFHKYESTFPADGTLAISSITPSTATSNTNGAYKVYGNTAALDNFYFADLVTAYNPTSKNTKVTEAPSMGNEVQLSFRKLTAKVRLGFYETVPGYSIRNVEFFTSDADDVADEIASLYSTGNTIYSKGAYTVYFPTVNNKADNTDYNKAHVVFAAEASGSSSIFTTGTTVNATREQTSTNESSTNVYLAENTNQPSYCGTSTAVDGKGAYTVVLPNETATALTLRVNYTLVSNDGSQETIKVWGAKAVVPAQYCQWKSNYAYTYIFKISDATNGTTDGLTGTHAGLTPITFDAVVVDDEEHTQQTITTVATPSITTYQKGRVITTDEYAVLASNGDIYITVQDQSHIGAILNDLSSKDELYKVTNASATVPATEANVMDALNMGTVDGSGNVAGRNGLTLTKATLATGQTAIPGADGNDITKVTVYGTSANEDVAVSANNVAKFAPEASTTYAYVYKISTGSSSTYNTAVVLEGDTAPSDWSESDNVYYSDFACTLKVNSTYTAGTYYKLMTNNNNTYAVKVIKVQ